MFIKGHLYIHSKIIIQISSPKPIYNMNNYKLLEENILYLAFKTKFNPLREIIMIRWA